MTCYPTDLKLVDEESLKITWSDGAEYVLTVRQLRSHCPCASCREKRRGEQATTELLPVLKPEEAQPIRIQAMRPVGKYAYHVTFNDGHDTGIFTFERLRSMGVEVQ